METITLEQLKQILDKPICIAEDLFIKYWKFERKSLYYFPTTEWFVTFINGEKVNETMTEKTAVLYYNEIEKYS